MKSLIIFVCASLLIMVQSQGIPTKSCPEGEHSVLYCPPRAEPTCDKQYLHEPKSPKPCGIPECFCDEGTVRNTATNKCVAPDDCC